VREIERGRTCGRRRAAAGGGRRCLESETERETSETTELRNGLS
jgi:hypothetical protein